MENLKNVLQMIPNEEIERILMLAKIKRKDPVIIINTAIITYFATTLKPTLKSYQTIYLENGKKISGNMMKLKQIGKNPWKNGTHGMTNHLADILKSVDENEVNKAILEYSYRLIDITLQDIIENSSKSEAKKYLLALEQENFLFVMLQIAVRVVGLELKSRGLCLENKTFDYMLDLLQKEKNKINKMFKECVKNDNIETAVSEYYNFLSNYLTDFEKREILVSGNKIKIMSNELSLLDDIGEEALFTFLGYLLGYLKDKYQKEKQLFEIKLITIK